MKVHIILKQEECKNLFPVVIGNVQHEIIRLRTMPPHPLILFKSFDL